MTDLNTPFFMPKRNLILIILLALLCTRAFATSQSFTLSVVPQFTPVDIGMRWAPLLKRLEAETGYGFQLRLLDRIPKFEVDFLAGTPDLLFLNPFHMLIAAEAQGYIPLVRDAEPLVGILVADRSGPIKQLSDLNGKNLAFPAPNAFGASLYMRALLAEREGIRFSSDFVGSHQNVYRHVIKGDAAAGGGIKATLDREPEALRQRLRILYTTPGVPPHPLAAHPRVPKPARDRIRNALLKIGKESAGRKLLDAVELGRITEADMTRDYLPLKKLKIEQHVISR
jgi:phosphonate transport system substrate-binding protein